MDMVGTFEGGAMHSQLKPRLLIATRTFGASGRPWLWRQVVGLSAFRKDLVCWERPNGDSQPTFDVREHLLPGNPAPYDGPTRWAHRFRTTFQGNFYASVGRERRLIATLLETTRPDIVLCHFGEVAMRMLPTARKAGIPLVAYFHGDFPFLRNRWYRWSLLRCIPHLAGVVVVTEGERRWFESHGMAPEKIHYIPCGAPTDLFRPTPRQPDEKVRFVMVSRLQRDKGCDVSVEAFAKVAAVCRNATLDVFGEGEELPALEASVERHGLRDKVRFRGHIVESALVRELPKFDVFIQHSRVREGSPVSLVEAMACGLAVVATPVGGIPDQVIPGETGYLVAEEDCASMAAAMEKLARDAVVRRRFGLSARTACVARHDAAKQTQKLQSVLLKLARR